MAAKCGGGGGGDSDECITRYADAESCLESQRLLAKIFKVFYMLVMFLGTDQVKTKDIRAMFMQIVNRESLQGLILILQSEVTAYAKKETEKFSFKVEFFQVSKSDACLKFVKGLRND
ncbi:hypothetical protein LWI28_015166 [Acer negundo]|uniref:Uncharacterized protein n=1 Tax=Acer negundo TaxID=4023 RepID=A0AAD5I9N6_ACENE|nr:hypothetical protein LWI28_015166 [Acer negundo]